jgi:hypothetical protein
MFFSSALAGQPTDSATLTVQTFLARHSNQVLPLQQIEKYPSDSFGHDPASKEAFLKSYRRFLDEYAKVQTAYVQYDQVAAFTAIRCNDMLSGAAGELSISAENRPDNSLYVAFALLTGAGVDYDKIGDRNHLETLARSYGVSEYQIENGIWETLTRDWNEILGRVVTMIGSHLDEVEKNRKEPFLLNVVHPYLTFVSRGYSMPDAVEQEVQFSFGRVFGNSPGARNFLGTYVGAFKEYVQGVSMDGTYDIKLNRLLGSSGYRISTAINHCVTYKLLDYRIKIDTLGIGAVLLQKRIGVSLLGIDMGQAIYSDSNVTLTYDYLLDEANDVEIVLNSDSLPKSYHPAANAMWKQLGFGMDAGKANMIYRTLLRSGFSGQSKTAVVNRLIRDIATHELKHKWDELATPREHWINVDFEISAHLAEAIYGGSLGYGLMNFINRIQKYYSGIEQPDIRSKLKPLIIESWNIARGLSGGTIKEDSAIERLKTIYANYLSLSGKKLPNLGAYEQAIVRGSLQDIPELKQ